MLTTFAQTGIMAAAAIDGVRATVPRLLAPEITGQSFPELTRPPAGGSAWVGLVGEEDAVGVHVFQAIPGQAFVLPGLQGDWIEAVELLGDGTALELGHNAQGQVVVYVPAELGPEEAIIVIKLHLVVQASGATRCV